MLEPFALGAEVVDLVEHSVEQRLGQGARCSDSLKLPDLTALALNPAPHALDFASDELDVRHLQASAKPLEQNKNDNATRLLARGPEFDFRCDFSAF
jgi:hypothetical protein